MYDLGKEQLLRGTNVQPAYAPVLAEMGVVTLAIDSWCFGERQHDSNGHRGEEDAFKLMLWRGQVLWGMMMFDEFRALSHLASRPEVDPQRLGVTGMSMGSTKAWWLAALDPRLRLAIDLCCLTDFDSLIAAHGLSGHSIFYYVPSLLKEFDTTSINELIVPRPHLSLNGRRDLLTPPAGVEKIRENLLPLYRQHGRQENCRIELFDYAHEETPEMRGLSSTECGDIWLQGSATIVSRSFLRKRMAPDVESAAVLETIALHGGKGDGFSAVSSQSIAHSPRFIRSECKTLRIWPSVRWRRATHG